MVWQIKAQKNSTFKTGSSEAKSCTPEITAHFKETQLSIPTILSRYKLQDIFNTHECDLLFQSKCGKFTGGKYINGRMNVAKVRNEPELARIRIGSAVGEKLPALITEKAKNPRCFKNEMSLPCMYEAQTKSWMESERSSIMWIKNS